MTSKEFKALKEELKRKARYVVIQRKPYTVVVAEVEYDSQRYVDFGFSKVNWPDWFQPRRGKEIALGRAIEGIARRVTNPDEKTRPTLHEFYIDYILGASTSSPPEEELLGWIHLQWPANSSTGT